MKKHLNSIFIIQQNRYKCLLSLTRIFVSTLILYKVSMQWNYAYMLFGGHDFLVPTNHYINEYFFKFNSDFLRENIYYFMCFFIFLLLLYLFGIGKNITALFVFIIYDIYQKLCPQILNGGDNILRFVLLYLVIADSFNYFSFEKYNNQSTLKIRNILSNFAGISISIHLCLVYFISAIHKIHADVWFNGVATYYTLSLDRFNGSSLNSIISKNMIFVVISTYGTLLLELLYPILVWNMKYRFMLLILMTILHLSIAIFMMLYDFQLLFIFLQLYFIEDRIIEKKLFSIVRKITYK